jgi:hypothetical protein
MAHSFNFDLVSGGYTDMAAGISTALALLEMIQEKNEVPTAATGRETYALAQSLHVLLSRMGMVNEITGNALIPGLFEPLNVNHWMKLDSPTADATLPTVKG